MSLQDKILKANDRTKRKLFDEKVTESGNNAKVVRLQVVEDDFGDETITLISHEEIVVAYPALEDIPLSRLRKDLSVQTTTSQQSLYLYDILPLEVRSLFVDQLHKGDILIRKLYDETDGNIVDGVSEENKPFYLTLRVTEPVGNFTNSLVNLRFNTAPYIQKFDQSIIDIIESY